MRTKKAFASADWTSGQLNALVKMLNHQGGEDGARKFMQGKLVVSEPTVKWREEDGIIYFSVTSYGKSGEDWFRDLRVSFSGYTEGEILEQFKSTNGITTEIALLPHFLPNERVKKALDFDSVLQGAKEVVSSKRKDVKFTDLSLEMAFLIKEKFSYQDICAMRTESIVAMHQPIGMERLLFKIRKGLSFENAYPYAIHSGIGYAIALSQIDFFN